MLSRPILSSYTHQSETYNKISGVQPRAELKLRLRLVIAAGSGQLADEPYTAKLSRLLERQKIPCDFLCWRRAGQTRSENLDPSNIKHIILLDRSQSKNHFLSLWYLFWMFALFREALRRPADELWLCSRFDSGLPIALASFIRPRRFVFIDRDRLSQSRDWPKAARRFLEYLEHFVARQAAIHLLPGSSRDYTGMPNVRIVRNTPTSWAINDAMRIASERHYERGKKPFTMYLNGWLHPTRGIQMILEAVRSLPPRDFCLLVAGKPACAAADELLEVPCVDYRGRLPNEEALALYYAADLALTFYDPSVKINRLAEPNKWFDCVATSTPFVTNNGIETLSDFSGLVDYQTVNYGAASALRSIVMSRAAMGVPTCMLPTDKKAKIPLWDEQFSGLLAEISASSPTDHPDLCR